jgi:hypothetical protein
MLFNERIAVGRPGRVSDRALLRLWRRRQIVARQPCAAVLDIAASRSFSVSSLGQCAKHQYGKCASHHIFPDRETGAARTRRTGGHFFLPEPNVGCHPAVFWLGAAAIVLIFSFLGFFDSRLPFCALDISASLGLTRGWTQAFTSWRNASRSLSHRLPRRLIRFRRVRADGRPSLSPGQCPWKAARWLRN